MPCGQSSPRTKRGLARTASPGRAPRAACRCAMRSATRPPSDQPSHSARAGKRRIRSSADRIQRPAASRLSRAAAVARQVHQVQGEVRGQALDQRREHAAVHGPAVQQHQGRAAGRAFHVHRAHAGIGSGFCAARVQAGGQRARRPAPSTSRFAMVSADRVMRRRASPAGTVGGRIAPTRKPRFRSAAETASARCVVAEHDRLDRRVGFHAAAGQRAGRRGGSASPARPAWRAARVRCASAAGRRASPRPSPAAARWRTGRGARFRPHARPAPSLPNSSAPWPPKALPSGTSSSGTSRAREAGRRHAAAALGADHADAVRVVHVQQRVLRARQQRQVAQRRQVAVHAEDAVGGEHGRAFAARSSAGASPASTSRVRVALELAARQARAVDQAGVVELVLHAEIARRRAATAAPPGWPGSRCRTAGRAR